MNTSLGWSDQATFFNATAALFGNAQRIMDSWAVLDAHDYRTTWTYLRKAMLAHWGNVKDSLSYFDAIFSIRPRTNGMDNLDSLTADVMEAF